MSKPRGTRKALTRQSKESHARSIVKSITYRVLIVISIFIITLLTTGRLADAATITGISAITGTIIYYLHERAWSHIHWGRK